MLLKALLALGTPRVNTWMEACGWCGQGAGRTEWLRRAARAESRAVGIWGRMVLKVTEKLCFPLHRMRDDFQQRSEAAWQTILKAAQAELKPAESVEVLAGWSRDCGWIRGLPEETKNSDVLVEGVWVRGRGWLGWRHKFWASPQHEDGWHYQSRLIVTQSAQDWAHGLPAPTATSEAVSRQLPGW